MGITDDLSDFLDGFTSVFKGIYTYSSKFFKFFYNFLKRNALLVYDIFEKPEVVYADFGVAPFIALPVFTVTMLYPFFNNIVLAPLEFLGASETNTQALFFFSSLYWIVFFMYNAYYAETLNDE